MAPLNTPLEKDKIAAMMKRFPAKKLDSGNLRSIPFRASFPSLFQKSKMKDDDNAVAKYGVTLLFPKGADLSAFEAMVTECAQAAFGKNVNLKSLRLPIRDQGEKSFEGYVDGAKFFNATSHQRPGIRGPNGKPLEDEEEIYAGCWCIATLRAYDFDTKGKGVAFGLQNIAKIADDTCFGGRAADPDEEFGDVLDGSANAEDMFA